MYNSGRTAVGYAGSIVGRDMGVPGASAGMSRGAQWAYDQGDRFQNYAGPRLENFGRSEVRPAVQSTVNAFRRR